MDPQVGLWVKAFKFYVADPYHETKLRTVYQSTVYGWMGCSKEVFKFFCFRLGVWELIIQLIRG